MLASSVPVAVSSQKPFIQFFPFRLRQRKQLLFFAFLHASAIAARMSACCCALQLLPNFKSPRRSKLLIGSSSTKPLTFAPGSCPRRALILYVRSHRHWYVIVRCAFRVWWAADSESTWASGRGVAGFWLACCTKYIPKSAIGSRHIHLDVELWRWRWP